MPARTRSRAWIAGALVTTAIEARAAPILHERIPPDPRDDLAMRVVLDGNIPAAIDTPSGFVSAPDPRKPAVTRPAEHPAAGGSFDAATAGKYVADTDTRRPNLLPYDEPFTPSTAPFKRMVAFDAVDRSFHLVVENPALTRIVVDDSARSVNGDESFFADIVVAGQGERQVRIPSVGPGARVIHARMGQGARDFGFDLWRDGADNWFVTTRGLGRLVMEVSIPRTTFGGAFHDPLFSDLHAPKVPAEVETAVNVVVEAIGVDRTSPRRALVQLVSYFRSFTDSDVPPQGHGNAYLDLALSRKGVCRHRAYAFAVTALGLGIPTRMVMNEAHAWVEVNDGASWKRIDLGGAGRTLDAPRDSAVVAYDPPPDPYPWPPNAQSGDDLGRRGEPTRQTRGGAAAGAPSAASTPSTSGSTASSASSARGSTSGPGREETPEDPSFSRISLDVGESDARRGAPLNVHGLVENWAPGHAPGIGAGEPCAHVRVEIGLLGPRGGRPLPVGSLATDPTGRFAGVLIVPFDVPAGDYDVVAHVPAGAGCAEAFSR